jgi:hypothetical protein
MTQYLLSVWHSDRNPIPDDPAVMQKAYKQVDELNAELQAKGLWVFGGGLHEPSSATVVSATDGGDPIMTDGPFAETKEQLGGFYLFEVESLDEAAELATGIPAAAAGAVEVRAAYEEGSE